MGVFHNIIAERVVPRRLATSKLRRSNRAQERRGGDKPWQDKAGWVVIPMDYDGRLDGPSLEGLVPADDGEAPAVSIATEFVGAHDTAAEIVQKWVDNVDPKWFDPAQGNADAGTWFEELETLFEHLVEYDVVTQEQILSVIYTDIRYDNDGIIFSVLPIFEEVHIVDRPRGGGGSPSSGAGPNGEGSGSSSASGGSSGSEIDGEDPPTDDVWEANFTNDYHRHADGTFFIGSKTHDDDEKDEDDEGDLDICYWCQTSTGIPSLRQEYFSAEEFLAHLNLIFTLNLGYRWR